ncbi:hypothetical protein CALCODRAFT_168569 [Calocera cornea HHB12733]|uniref:Uncharacterized protein n=1 Tax=Calocera cornea HHB12733 TaxID=1353952 RepID=A0A165CHL1_9BASI|nr:hypothetical protein CALCODRAFT_168569 [Calocera cornea HHB12733]
MGGFGDTAWVGAAVGPAGTASRRAGTWGGRACRSPGRLSVACASAGRLPRLMPSTSTGQRCTAGDGAPTATLTCTPTPHGALEALIRGEGRLGPGRSSLPVLTAPPSASARPVPPTLHQHRRPAPVPSKVCVSRAYVRDAARGGRGYKRRRGRVLGKGVCPLERSCEAPFPAAYSASPSPPLPSPALYPPSACSSSPRTQRTCVSSSFPSPRTATASSCTTNATSTAQRSSTAARTPSSTACPSAPTSAGRSSWAAQCQAAARPVRPRRAGRRAGPGCPSGPRIWAYSQVRAFAGTARGRIADAGSRVNQRPKYARASCGPAAIATPSWVGAYTAHRISSAAQPNQTKPNPTQPSHPPSRHPAVFQHTKAYDAPLHAQRPPAIHASSPSTSHTPTLRPTTKPKPDIHVRLAAHRPSTSPPLAGYPCTSSSPSSSSLRPHQGFHCCTPIPRTSAC